MSNKKFNTLVYIGRFQPVHNAHIEIIHRATSMCDKLIIIIGSVGLPRTYKNPWSGPERSRMIVDSLSYIMYSSDCEINIQYAQDYLYNDQVWATQIQQIVSQHTNKSEKIGIIGHKKDESTFYLDMFPQWEFVEQPLIEPLNATNIRDLYFRNPVNMKFIENVVPEPVFNILLEWKDSSERNQVISERTFIETYKQQFASLAYPPVFVTTDAIVIQSGHILMIKRKAEPGRGLWALPGGFLNANSDRSLKDAMLRELREETGIKVPSPVLSGSISAVKVFDAIDRSARGRTITHAYLIILPDGPLPKIKGMDDAEKARWIPISNVNSEQCFEDHYEIIQNMIGLTNIS